MVKKRICKRKMEKDIQSCAIRLAHERTIGKKITLENIKNKEKKISDLKIQIDNLLLDIDNANKYLSIYEQQQKKRIRYIKSKKNKIVNSRIKIEKKKF